MEKRKRVLISTVVLKNVDSEVYGSHLSFAYRCGRECLDYDFYLAHPQRLAIDYGRNMAVCFAVANDFDYLFFYDDDTELPPNIMNKMLTTLEKFEKVDVLTASYYVRGSPFEVMAFVEDPGKKSWRFVKEGDFESLTDPETGLVGPLKAVGNGCTLYRVSLLKGVDQHLNVELPQRVWFKTTYGVNTEDVWFFYKAHAQFENVGIYLDPSIVCGHICARKEIVNKDNVVLLRKRAIEDQQAQESLFIVGDHTPKEVGYAKKGDN